MTRAWLMSVGASEAAITARLIAGALGAARHALRANQPLAAREAVRLLCAQEGLRPRTRLHALVLRIAAGLMREQALPP